jgi:peptide deformylase
MIKEVLKLNKETENILRKKCIDVKNNEITKEIIQNLKDTLEQFNNGAGLAAPQIGENVNIFITRNYKDDKPKDFLTFINPKIINRSKEKVTIPDGCLSISNVAAETYRNSWIEVEYYNEEFNKTKEELIGFQSVVFQHEIDHLEGKLFIDYLEEQQQKDILSVLKRNSEGENVVYMGGKIIEISLKK